MAASSVGHHRIPLTRRRRRLVQVTRVPKSDLAEAEQFRGKFDYCRRVGMSHAAPVGDEKPVGKTASGGNSVRDKAVLGNRGMSKRHVLRPSEGSSRHGRRFSDLEQISSKTPPGGIVAAIAIVHLTVREKSLRRPRGMTELCI